MFHYETVPVTIIHTGKTTAGCGFLLLSSYVIQLPLNYLVRHRGLDEPPRLFFLCCSTLCVQVKGTELCRPWSVWLSMAVLPVSPGAGCHWRYLGTIHTASSGLSAQVAEVQHCSQSLGSSASSLSLTARVRSTSHPP